jgi:hypothetical protein
VSNTITCSLNGIFAAFTSSTNEGKQDKQYGNALFESIYQPLNTCNSAFCTSTSDGGKHFKAFISGANALNFFSSLTLKRNS